MPTIPVITPIRLARITLAGLVVAGMASSGIAFAAGWTGPSSPAPFNNTPELIWNAQETGFAPQDASFNITGSGVLGQFAAGGFALDPSGVAITTPSLWSESVWATDFEADNAMVFNDLIIDPGTGGLTLGGVRLTEWPASGDGDVTGISAGPNLVGGGDTGEISLDLSSTPTVDSLTVNSDATFSGPVDITGGNLIVTNVARTTIGSTMVGGSLYGVYSVAPAYFSRVDTDSMVVDSEIRVTGGSILMEGASTITTPRLCIGADCRDSWPAGGGGGAVSITGGTGITASPSTITGTGELALNTAYTDSRYVNAQGDAAMSGTFFVNLGTLQVLTNGVGGAVSGNNNGSGPGVIGTVINSIGVRGDSSGSGIGVNGLSLSGVGVRGMSDTGYGVHGSTANGAAAGYFTRGGTAVSVGTATRGVDANQPIQAPQFCIGASCISAWPGGGGGGTVTSVGSDTGLTGGPITGTGSLALDTAYTDDRYVNVNNIGPELLVGQFYVSGNTAGDPIFNVRNTGAGTGVEILNDSASQPALRAQNENASGDGGYISNIDTGIYARLASGAYGVNTNGNIITSGNITTQSLTLSGESKSSWPTAVTSITQGTGIVATPNPITGAGSLALNTTYTDGRYVNNIGPDLMTGEFTVNSSNALVPTITAYNSTASGSAGYFQNNSIYTLIAYGSAGVYTTGQVYSWGNVRGATVTATGLLTAGSASVTGAITAGSVTLGSTTKTAWPDRAVSAEGSIAAGAVGWVVVTCGGYETVGVACYINSPTPTACATRRSGETGMQISRNLSYPIFYTLYCISGL